ncbi:hypothetical protein GOP47_0026832 [Adiantum capillus-veneris]|nr:hypothetical protein GOP47_0026832 [Adiantum capillus-veneris]
MAPCRQDVIKGMRGEDDWQEEKNVAHTLRRTGQGILSSSIWHVLPQELVERSLTTLPARDLVRWSVTCRSWHEAILSPSTPPIVSWRQQLQAQYSDSISADGADAVQLPWFLCGTKPEMDAALGLASKQCEWVAFDPNTDTWYWIPAPAAIAEYAPERILYGNELLCYTVMNCSRKNVVLICWTSICLSWLSSLYLIQSALKEDDDQKDGDQLIAGSASTSAAAAPTSTLLRFHIFQLDFATHGWMVVDGAASDTNLRSLPRKSGCIANCSQVLLLAGASPYLYHYTTNVWRIIPPCTEPGSSKRRVGIASLGCAFDASLDGNLPPLPQPQPPSHD